MFYHRKKHLMLSALGILATYSAVHANDVVWTYDEDYTGQEEWGLLTKEFAACEQGTLQSPIDIAFTSHDNVPSLSIDYHPSKATIRHNGYTVVIDVEGQNSITSNGTKYELKSIELHTPGEHTIKDQFYLVELEFFHRSSEGKNLILSVFGEIGPKNLTLETILEKAPEKSSAKTAQITINLPLLLSDSASYYAYTGSLTTPPCTEGIEWRILKQPIMLSQEQLAKMGNLIGRNARVIQPAYMRTIKETAQ